MPSHYGKERRQAAASRAKTQRLVARASRALAGGAEEGAQELFQGLAANQRKKVGTEAPELKAHGVKPSK